MLSSRDKQAPYPPKRPIKGFGHINRYWDPIHDVYTAKILPGEYYVTINEEAVVENCLLDHSLLGESAVVRGTFQRLNVGDSAEVDFH